MRSSGLMSSSAMSLAVIMPFVTDSDRIFGSPFPHHNRDLHPKTLRSIIRQSG